MSNLKLEVKNFTGERTFRFRIRPVTKKNTFTLFYDVEINNDWELVAATADYVHSHNSTSDCISSVLKRASKKWGVQLTKANLKVA